MNNLTRTEKLLIWMKRKGFTQELVAQKLNITRQTFILRMKDDNFKPEELNILKTLGAEV